MDLMVDDQEINELLNQCADSEDSGESKYPGMSYEQGLAAAIRWMVDGDSHPLDE